MAQRQVLAAITPLLAIAVGTGACRIRVAMRALRPVPLAARADDETAPRHDDQHLTAAVLLDHPSTEVSDVLLPLELLAAWGALNVSVPAGATALPAGGFAVRRNPRPARRPRPPRRTADRPLRRRTT